MLILPLLLATAATSSGGDITTEVPLDTLQRCLTTQLSRNGRATAINTASGVMLDFAFQTVGIDGKVAASHLTFAIDDLGTQRRLTATAPTEADAALAQQMLRGAANACIADVDLHTAE